MTLIQAGPARLYLMPVAWTAIPAPSGPVPMVAVCYLVQMNDGTNILIDSGFPDDFALPDGMSPMTEKKTVIEHLAGLGLAPDDIDTVICTHFDVDHAGHHEAFASAEFVVQRSHYELARNGDARYERARSHWDHPGLTYRLVDGDTDLFPGVELIETSGHAPGHQSVLVRLAESGPILLVIDAVPFQSLFTPERPATPADADEEAVRSSTRKLLNLVESEQVALTVFGHDGTQWQSLKKAPEFYA